jgi:hypothetical protein
MSEIFISFLILRKCLLGAYNIVPVMMAMVLMVMKMCCRPGLRLESLTLVYEAVFQSL